MEEYLIINPGSTNIKLAYFYKKTQIGYWEFDTNDFKKNILKLNYQFKPSAIAIRIVAPGNYFRFNRLIDQNFIDQLKNIELLNPLHIKITIDSLNACKQLFNSCPIVAISDSAFHNTIADVAKIYAIPSHLTSILDIYKFGYHGISIQSIMRKLKKNNKVIPKKIIICHLGGGCSVTAIKNAKSIDTSMGFSPLDGLPMMTRCGSIDPQIIIYLQDKLKLSLPDLTNLLYTQSGLNGISGIDDFKKLLELKKTNQAAALAYKIFVYSIKKYIGAYREILGGVDLIVFTGKIGQNSHKLRSDVLKNSFKTQIAVVETDEMAEIALQLRKFLV